MEYPAYLQSEHWQNVRSQKLLKSPKCQICGSNKNLQVHHKYYKTRLGKSLLGNETNGCLITLCPSCHRLIHHHFGIEAKKINKKIMRIQRLIEIGVEKKKAFWIISTDGMWEALYPELKRRLHAR